MTQFFMHVVGTPERINDPEPEAFDSVEAAMENARTTAREIAGDHVRQGVDYSEHAFEIRDAAGAVRATVAFADGLSGEAASGPGGQTPPAARL